ncbi:MAG: nucleotidyl transferase AbiEii/AbiGii toxin family protein [Candidatus Omnitrophica bacterium]|nr:nucleotidyl transferase AbiEii/AbiGii toxin family protein [Candidatus Omnitrophota bacterium]MBU0879026.1 nucleotidyl transferase AbiEii/AbiGii toxin family protein [Candidatus Omnitrophota bacterium]
MIAYSQIQRLSAKQELPEEIIEKDYLIELILFYFAKDDYFKERFVFRGGTALKKVYFPDYRFSEDLDFLVDDNENLREYEQRIDEFLAVINSKYPFQIDKRLELNEDRLQFFILYDIFTEIKAVKELKVDILRDSFIPSYQTIEILFGYQEFKKENLSLKTYRLETVVSDKISRILDVDNEPRDIYDLWYLLKLELNVVSIKTELKKRYGYDIYFHNLLTELTREVYRRNWRIRLEKQIPKLPRYEIITEELKGLIKTKLLS